MDRCRDLIIIRPGLHFVRTEKLRIWLRFWATVEASAVASVLTHPSAATAVYTTINCIAVAIRHALAAGLRSAISGKRQAARKAKNTFTTLMSWVRAFLLIALASMCVRAPFRVIAIPTSPCRHLRPACRITVDFSSLSLENASGAVPTT